MTKDQLIAKQQLEIEQYREMSAQNKRIVRMLHGRFFAIGQPLNDNVLQFNKDQIKWALKTAELIEAIELDIT